MKKAKIGIIGCGNISGIYLTNLSKFNNTEVYAVADLIEDRVVTAAKKYNVPHIYTAEEMCADNEVDIILNITQPKVHYEICELAIKSGKHVHVEKPLSIKFEDGKRLVELAKQKGVRIGCAPDTFMGGGLQTSRKLIEDGVIGEPIAATLFMMGHGHESWHPDPEFYYEVGGGPMLDMGPYYLTTLVSMLGEAKRITASTNITFPTRTITSEKKNGKIIEVEVPTHISGILEMKNGAVANIITSFDVWSHSLPFIEIYGSKGTLKLPDPNTFGGPVFLRKAEDNDWQEICLTHAYEENNRGIALADMAASIFENKRHRAHGDMGLHVLEIMEAFHTSSNIGKHIDITTKFEKPEMIPVGYNEF